MTIYTSMYFVWIDTSNSPSAWKRPSKLRASTEEPPLSRRVCPHSHLENRPWRRQQSRLRLRKSSSDISNMRSLVRAETLVQLLKTRLTHLVIAALQQQMDRLGDTSLIGGERIDATEHCADGILRLSKEVKDANVYLPAYDQRTYAQVQASSSGPETEARS